MDLKLGLKKAYWFFKGLSCAFLRKIGRFDLVADIKYHDAFHEWIDWKNPKDLNEKINYLSFKTDTSLWSICADKYAMRQYVTERVDGGDKYLVPLLGKWNTAEDIDFDSLPNKFVIKTNNGSYDAIIVRDKSREDCEEIRKRMSKALEQRFGYESCEIHYLRMPPCIIAEELLETDNPHGLIDYKLWCFNGEPDNFFICSDRDNSKHVVNYNYYTLGWERKPEKISDPFRNDVELPRPQRIGEMIMIAKTLSLGCPQMRVDFYEVNGRVYVGELTFTTNQGRIPFYTKKTLLEMGSKIKINLCNN